MILSLVSMSKQRVTKLDGNANNALKTGVTYWNLNNDTSNRNQNITSHLASRSLLIHSKWHRTMPLGKTQSITSKGVSREIERSEANKQNETI